MRNRILNRTLRREGSEGGVITGEVFAPDGEKP
jgi:hypothetical protein